MRSRAVLALLAAAGCRATGVFDCDRDDQCVRGSDPGRCEVNGYCSFADPMCPDGWRYDEYAIDGVAKTCVMPTLCFGTGTVADVCFPQTPDGALVITSRTVDTALDGGTNCTMHVTQGGASLCVIGARSIEIPAGGSLVAIGPDPLVLVAASSIAVDGDIHVESDRGGMTGAGARTACATGLDGQGGTAGGGGGAGGALVEVGGAGGRGNPAAAGGVPGGANTATVLEGGCAGGAGAGAASTMSGAGAAGAGGGAIALVAGRSIAITGTIDASGAGGGAGIGAGGNATGGGGGGGAGGMITLDAPRISCSGVLFATGGGGGGGGGEDSSQPGSPGADPTDPLTAAAGGNGGQSGGGDGGSGSIGAAPGMGRNGGNSGCGGGGGGGAPGVIHIFQVAPASVGGTITPPAS